MSKKKSISYSQFSQWDKCPWMWKLNYIDRLGTFTDSIHTLFGTSMHEVFQKYLKVMYSKTIKEADELSLEELLEERMKLNFLEIVKENGGVEFCTKQGMIEFYYDGVKIIDFFKKRRAEYFSKKGYELIGIESTLDYDLPKNIKFKGYIDIVIKDIIHNRIKIIDIKTSTMGWNKYMKADKNKTNQLLIYKQFYSKQFDVPIDRISVEYFILKRKLYENVDFPQKRIQLFSPASGVPSLNRVNRRMKEFIDECFTEDGEHKIDYIYNKLPSKKNCRWCEFKDKPELCDKNGVRV